MAVSIALIVAAGRGERALRPDAPGQGPKQYWLLAGKPVLRRAVEAFLDHAGIAGVQVVIREEDRAAYESAVAGLALMPVVIGGAARQQSVRNGLEALVGSAPRNVLIHDGARPLVSS